MLPEHWQKIKPILEEAIEIPAASRSAFLDKACLDDSVLRKEIEHLLDYEDTQADLLEKTAFSAIENDFNRNGKNLIGKQIGNYKILEELGTGGMGAVFLATRADGAFEQKAALKLIKCGMDSDAVLQRFFNERQILASLEHPNIAHLIDGGTTDNDLPYFVLEYVEGEPITEYAKRRNLDLEEKLKMFREVCAAVSFAHQNLVIHRDLKPSNILITKDGKVKLLDFGIAKLLKADASDAVTATQMQVFTPEYASPEQIRGEKLTTATDVYSLGVILYELLTGNRPFNTQGKNISEIIKEVCETEPARPSSVVSGQWSVVGSDTKSNGQRTANSGQNTNPKAQITNPKSLRGDLDNIILQALRKEPERRYSSVEQFSEDIRRHLVGLPVTASKDTWNYRASKFIQRNKIGVAAVALIILSLAGGLTATLFQANKARQRFNDVRQLANSFLFEFHDAIENLPGSTAARELVVKRALEYLDKLSAEAGGDAELQRELATAYEKIGKIQGNSYSLNLGDTDGAMKSYRKSLEMREKLIANDPNNRKLQNELANSYQGVGDMLYTVGKLKEGLTHYEKTAAIRQNLAEAEPNNLEYKQNLAETYTRLGDIKGLEGYPNLGDTSGSIENYQKAVSLGEQLTKAEPKNNSFKASLAMWRTNLGMLQSTTGDNLIAIENGNKAITAFEEILAADPNNSQHQTNLLSTYTSMRFPLVEEMRFDEATRNMRKVIQNLEKMIAADPKNAFAKRALGVSYNALGRTQTETGDAKTAVEIHKKALEIAESQLAADTESGENRRDAALTLEFLANAQLKAGDTDAALSNYRKSLDILKEKSSEDSSVDLSNLYMGIGRSLAARGNIPEAAKNFREALPAAVEAAKKSPLNIRTQNRLAIFYFEGGKVLSKLAQSESIENNSQTLSEAKEWLEKSLEIWNAMKQNNKLSKLNANYPNEVSAALNQISKNQP